MLKRLLHTAPASAAINMALAFAAFMLARFIFVLENLDTYGASLSWSALPTLLRGSLRFDTAAILYINALYLLLTLLPLHIKENDRFHRAMRWLFVVTNAVGVALSLCDAVYFPYSGRRTTMTIFDQFAAESNLGSIFLTEVINHWYLAVALAVITFLLWRLFRKPDLMAYSGGAAYYGSQTVALLATATLTVLGIRGSFIVGTKPMNIETARLYAARPADASLVLNTPYTLIRSIGKQPFITPRYMTDAEMEAAYSPIHHLPANGDTIGAPCRGHNVVIIMVESLATSYIGFYNGGQSTAGGQLRAVNLSNSLTPCVDSIAARALTFTQSFANGRVSMDAMPSTLCGIPMMVENFFLTPAAMNDINAMPAMLATMGYTTAFFHGAHNGSMQFDAFARSAGITRYYGLNEYRANYKGAGHNDWDGKWAIYDEPFLQYTLDELEHMPQPFISTIFTASNHHPYNVPQEFAATLPDTLKNTDQPILRTVRYTDHALSDFFRRAATMPWFNNTLFVILADHTNVTSQPLYSTAIGRYRIPIILYTPDQSLPAALRDDIVVQQTDLTPSLLHLLGYKGSFVAFGNDIFATAPDSSWAFSYNDGIYQLVTTTRLLQFDGTRLIGLYDYHADPLLRHNLAGHEDVDRELTLLKAIIQQYMQRMNDNLLTVGHDARPRAVHQ